MLRGADDRPPVLVTGAAGFVGQHTLRSLREAGRRSIAIDRRVGGVSDDHLLWVRADACDEMLLATLLEAHGVGAVVHLAARTDNAGSLADPIGYYRDNLASTLAVLRACARRPRMALVFASTAAVYGRVAASPVDERAPTQPETPYARSKLFSEEMILDQARSHGLPAAILRYFNVGGPPLEGTDRSEPGETSLLARVCAATEEGTCLTIFGDDYETADRTCVRDYVHVADVARANVMALERLEEQPDVLIANCGSGIGKSVRQVVTLTESLMRRRLVTRIAGRRQGDVPEMVADLRRLREATGWAPQRSDLTAMLREMVDAAGPAATRPSAVARAAA